MNLSHKTGFRIDTLANSKRRPHIQIAMAIFKEKSLFSVTLIDG